MSQSKRKPADKRSVEQTSDSKVVDRDRKGGRAGFIIIVSVFIVIIVSIIGFFKYQEGVPYRHTVITVDDVTIRMDYFLKRLRLTGSDPMAMLGNIAREQMIKLGAPRYGVEVSQEDIDRELRGIARGESETISEDEFKEWYRQLLNETGLSDSEYKEMLHTALLEVGLQQYLAERMPTVAEQVHLYYIVIETDKEAEEVRARWEAGEDFSDLARELSLDEQSKENGGELGWFPADILTSRLEFEAFSLAAGSISESLPYFDESDPSSPELLYFYLLMVSEKADAREVNEEHLPILRAKVLDGWFSEEWGLHDIQYHGFNNGFDSKTYAWINWQLSKE